MEAHKVGLPQAPIKTSDNSLVTAAKAAVTDEEALKLRIIEEESVRKKPEWVKYYRTVSYVSYGCIAVFSWFYLIYIAIYQAHPRMQIQYVSIVRFLEYNSYSIMSPLLCPIFMGMLAYQVKKEIALKEGDFFGVLGTFLFLALMSFHDAYGIYNQVETTSDHNRTTSRLDPPPENMRSRNDLAWQYAWSTKPACAKRFVRNLNYQHESDKKHANRQVLLDYGQRQQRMLQADNARQLLVTANALSNCNDFHDNKNNSKTRKWMTDLHKEFNCCGPHGFNSWKKWFNNERKTGCDINLMTGTDIPGCYDPLIKWLNGIFVTTLWIMIIQGLLYLFAMLIALAHHTAMKYEKSQVAKAHSLLEVTVNPMELDGLWWRENRPIYRPMVVGSNIPDEEKADSKGVGATDTKGDLRSHTQRPERDKYAPILKRSKQ